MIPPKPVDPERGPREECEAKITCEAANSPDVSEAKLTPMACPTEPVVGVGGIERGKTTTGGSRGRAAFTYEL